MKVSIWRQASNGWENCHTVSIRGGPRYTSTHSHTHILTHTHTHARAHLHPPPTHTYWRTHTHILIHTRAHTRTHAHIPTHTHTHSRTQTHIPRKQKLCFSTIFQIQKRRRRRLPLQHEKYILVKYVNHPVSIFIFKEKNRRDFYRAWKKSEKLNKGGKPGWHEPFLPVIVVGTWKSYFYSRQILTRLALTNNLTGRGFVVIKCL